MSPQMACPRGCKITLAAFISVVCFQMFPQTVFPGGCVITLREQLPEQALSISWHCQNWHWGIVYCLHLSDFSGLCVLKCFFKWPARE